MRNLIIAVLMFCLGCATDSNQYGGLYNNAVSNGTSVTLIRDGDFKTLSGRINGHLGDLGYKNVLYSEPAQGLIVVVKKLPAVKAVIAGDSTTDRMIVKYTKAGEGKTRVDLVNASTNMAAQGVVDKDIQKLAERIKED